MLLLRVKRQQYSISKKFLIKKHFLLLVFLKKTKNLFKSVAKLITIY